MANMESNTRTVDTHMSRLRRKLALSDDTDWRLVAIYQHGYRLERGDDTEAPVEAVSGGS
jgi:DNA-binding response OmpR family regulator